MVWLKDITVFVLFFRYNVSSNEREDKRMLHDMAVRSTELLEKRKIIRLKQEKIYIYGFELLYSLLISVGTMLGWSLLLGCTGQVILFLLYFIPIRMAAGGYHAKSYGACFFWSNVVTLVSVMTAELLWKIGGLWIELAMWGFLLVSVVYIAQHAPVVSKKAPMKEELVARNKKIAIRILVPGSIMLILLRIVLNKGLSYVGMIAFCIVAFMIRITKEGGTS